MLRENSYWTQKSQTEKKKNLWNGINGSGYVRNFDPGHWLLQQ